MVHWMNQYSALRKRGTALRSAGVGVLATATDLAALTALVMLADLSPRAASLPALAFGVAFQFVGNKIFAFRDRSPAWARQGALFLGVESLGFACNLVLFDLAQAHVRVPYLLLRLFTTSLVYFGVCLPLWSLVFRRHEEASS